MNKGISQAINLIRRYLVADWEQTRIWTHLKTRRDESADVKLVCDALGLAMPIIERVLKSSSTSPTDFTLHDEDHSFRVAEWMYKIIPNTTWHALSHLELALLLLSAYLHDVGMSPVQKLVRSIHDYLITSDESLLDEEERAEFCDWLDSHSYSFPLTESLRSSEELIHVREAASMYCRHRHNSWSEKWIRAQMPKIFPSPPYPKWEEDLIDICKSHHEGIAALSSPRFDPITINGRTDIHLRYLACVLRLSDILDVDPERTPKSILQHREVVTESLVYWWKDHEISIELHNNKIHLSARPSRAFVHKAILDTADMIEEELRLCHQLTVEKPFDHNIRVPTRKFPHSWEITPFLQTSVIPRENTYEFIDGAFRPSSGKILRLLGSRELYLTPNSAIREILQNAFDAVRERIAYERLDQGLDAVELGNRHKVTLSLHRQENDYILVCKDDGAGMSKRIIRDHFLVSGAAERPDLKSLSRRCNAAGFSLERTGQFGIGVLSYFLLANAITVTTRRLIEADNAAENGWQFTTEGISSFGELQRDCTKTVGTTLTLHLRSELVHDPTIWWQEVVNYIRETVVRLPCSFAVCSELEGCSDSISGVYGWLRTDADLTKLAFSWFESEIEQTSKYIGSASSTSSDDQKRIARLDQMRQTSKDARARLRWNTFDGIEIEGVGVCRISVPFFELEGGDSPVYMKATNVDGKIEITPLFFRSIGDERDYTATGTDSLTLFSWKGMSVRLKKVFEQGSRQISLTAQFGPSHHTIVEIDCYSREFGTLSLNRENLDLGDDVDDWTPYRLVAPHARTARLKVLEIHKDSPFAILQYVIAREQAQATSNHHWLHTCTKPEGQYWEKVKLPATTHTSIVSHETLILGDHEVNEISGFSMWEGGSSWEQFWPISPTCLAVLLGKSNERYLLPIWDSFADSGCWRLNSGVCKFPDGWEHVVTATAPNLGQVWNASSAIVHLQTDEAMNWLKEFERETSREVLLNAVAEDPQRSAVFLLNMIKSRRPERWTDIVEHYSEFAGRIWSNAVGSDQRLVNIVQELKNEQLVTNCYVYTCDGCNDTNELEQLPLPTGFVVLPE